MQISYWALYFAFFIFEVLNNMETVTFFYMLFQITLLKIEQVALFHLKYPIFILDAPLFTSEFVNVLSANPALSWADHSEPFPFLAVALSLVVVAYVVLWGHP